MTESESKKVTFTSDELTRIFGGMPTAGWFRYFRENYPEIIFDSTVFRDYRVYRIAARELVKFGIDPELFGLALELDEAAIERLCLELIGKLAERERLLAAGEDAPVHKKKAISDGLIAFILRILLDELQVEKRPLPAALVVLIREQLGGAKSEFLDQDTETRRWEAISIAASLLRTHGKFSAAQVAKVMKVPTSSVTRLFPKGALERLAQAEVTMATRPMAPPAPSALGKR